jgi:hypothetical protein
VRCPADQSVPSARIWVDTRSPSSAALAGARSPSPPLVGRELPVRG